jgi:hypothetical protein
VCVCVWMRKSMCFVWGIQCERVVCLCVRKGVCVRERVREWERKCVCVWKNVFVFVCVCVCEWVSVRERRKEGEREREREREREGERERESVCSHWVIVTYASAALPKKLECHCSRQRNQSVQKVSKIFHPKICFLTRDRPFLLRQVPTF